MITPVVKFNGRFETRLCFRTFDWLLAEQITSNEITAEKLDVEIDTEQKLLLLLSIYPDQSTFLHQIASKSPETDKSKYAAQLKALLEPSEAFTAPDITGMKEEV